MPQFLTPDAQSLLRALFKRNPVNRLGEINWCLCFFFELVSFTPFGDASKDMCWNIAYTWVRTESLSQTTMCVHHKFEPLDFEVFTAAHN